MKRVETAILTLGGASTAPAGYYELVSPSI
jgi:hypothetical protein